MHGPDGDIVHEIPHTRSGDQTGPERVLGFPDNMNASHTECRVCRMTGAPSQMRDNQMTGDSLHGTAPVPQGGYVVINGTRPPCGSCRRQMEEAAQATGATYVYVWNNGKSWWQAFNPLG